MSESVLQVEGLRKLFPAGKPSLFGQPVYVHAVDGVSFELGAGEVLALVGESGCGKSTLALTLMSLEPLTEGKVVFKGRDVTDLKGRELKTLRREIQMIFQDPYESLNPLMTVGEIVAEPLKVHGLAKGKGQRLGKVKATLETSGLSPAESYLPRRPFELSGGQRQRVVIASSLVLEPSVLIADEPVSMLDVSIRAEILNVLKTLKETRRIAMLFITHDLSTAAHFADRIAVMYLGRIVEIGETREILKNPQHPYTKALLSVIPVPNPRLRREQTVLKGDPPDPVNLPTGCRFAPRCPAVMARCHEFEPLLMKVAPVHEAACWLLEEALTG